MTWIKQYAEKRSAKDPEFKAAYEEEAALLALVRARQRSNLTQQNLAKTLRVSQPYIAQVERGSKPMSLSFMVRYANAVGATIQITPQHENTVPA
jgi:DNA-binding XRE family transcriptional regulator